MSRPKNFEVTFYRSDIIHQDILEQTSIDSIINTEDDDDESNDLKVLVLSSFDYQKKPGYKWYIYIDIGIRIENIAQVFVRSSFELIKRNTEWDEIFNEKIFTPLTGLALDKAIENFYKFLEKKSVELAKTLKLDGLQGDEHVKIIADKLLKQYTTYRRIDDINNEYLNTHITIVHNQTYDSEIKIKMTFAVLDEVLYSNNQFKREHNRKVFFEEVVETKYHTLKYNSYEIEQKPVKHTLTQTIFFMICVDCALQILVSDKADILIDSLEKKGVTAQMIKDYIHHGSDFLNTTNEWFRESNVEIGNLKEKHEWYNLIR